MLFFIRKNSQETPCAKRPPCLRGTVKPEILERSYWAPDANGLSPCGTDSAPGGDRPKLGKPVELRVGEGLSVMAGKETI